MRLQPHMGYLAIYYICCVFHIVFPQDVHVIGISRFQHLLLCFASRHNLEQIMQIKVT